MKNVAELKKGVSVLCERLVHQRAEVVEAEKRLGQPGYNKWYLSRMVANCKATERMLNGYKKALKRR